MTVPEGLLQPCQRPPVDVRTNEGMARGLRDYEEALRVCNDDKAAIRRALD